MTGFNLESMMTQENQIKQIPCDMLVPYHNHKFTLYSDDRKEDMVQSIKDNGVMQPIVCRPLSDGNYEILIGHNRWQCSQLAGLDTIPAIIKEHMDEETAEEYVNVSNLLQRGFTELKISEQAQVVSSSYFKLFSQGKRTDIENNLKDMEHGKPTNSREKVGADYGLSRNTVARLVRIDKLNGQLKNWIDDKQLSIRSGVELSYLSESDQDKITNIYSDEEGKMKAKISVPQAKHIRELAELNQLDEEELINKPQKNKFDVKKISIPLFVYDKYLKNRNEDEIQRIVEVALERYYKEF